MQKSQFARMKDEPIKMKKPANRGLYERVNDGTRTHDPQNHNLMF